MSNEWDVTFATMDEMRFLAESAELAWVLAFHSTDMMPVAICEANQSGAPHE